MKKILKSELYKAFINKRFLITILAESAVVLAFVFINVVPVITQTIPWMFENIDAGWVTYMPGAYYTWLGLMNCAVHAVIKAILPLLIAIPYGDSLYLEEQSHYVYHINTRTKKSNYYFAKLLTMFLSGGMVAAFPYLLSFLINIALLPMETVIPSTSVSLGNIVILSQLYYAAPLLYVFAYLFLTFVGFGILNCFCFTASYVFSNRFLVTLFPFIIDYFMCMIGDFFGGRNRTPWIYLNINSFWKTDIPAAIIQFSIFLMIIMATYFYKCGRRPDRL